MKPHPHAEVLRAIADGVPLSEFEFTFGISWRDMIDLDWFWQPHQYTIRRKTRHIMVNGFKVPKPLDVMTGECSETIFNPSVDAPSFFESDQKGSDWAKRCFERGIAHDTQEAAIAHAKAMLGIDPEYLK